MKFVDSIEAVTRSCTSKTPGFAARSKDLLTKLGFKQVPGADYLRAMDEDMPAYVLVMPAQRLIVPAFYFKLSGETLERVESKGKAPDLSITVSTTYYESQLSFRQSPELIGTALVRMYDFDHRNIIAYATLKKDKQLETIHASHPLARRIFDAVMPQIPGIDSRGLRVETCNVNFNNEHKAKEMAAAALRAPSQYMLIESDDAEKFIMKYLNRG